MSALDRELALRLLTEAAGGPGGKAGVARRLGYQRALIARTLSPNDPLEISERLARRVLEVLHVRDCPYLGISIPAEQCHEINHGPAPTWDPAAMEQRRTCQTCAFKPAQPAEGETK